MKIKRDKIIVTIGEFDPIESEDIAFFKKAKLKGDWLIVGVHSDNYLKKYEKSLNKNYESRRSLITELKCVDEVFSYDDIDGTACQLLKIVQIVYPNSEIFFVTKNSDKETLPESKIKGIKFLTLK
jgi:cytidyltransferase-like protein